MSRADLAAELRLLAEGEPLRNRRRLLLQAAEVVHSEPSHEDLALSALAAGRAYDHAAKRRAHEVAAEDSDLALDLDAQAAYALAESSALAALLRGQAELLRLARGDA